MQNLSLYFQPIFRSNAIANLVSMCVIINEREWLRELLLTFQSNTQHFQFTLCSWKIIRSTSLFSLSIFLSTQKSQVRLVHFLWDWILDTYKTIQGNRVHKLFTLSVPQLDLHLLTLMTTRKHPSQMCTKKAFRKLRSYRLDSSRKSEKEIKFSSDQLNIKKKLNLIC